MTRSALLLLAFAWLGACTPPDLAEIVSESAPAAKSAPAPSAPSPIAGATTPLPDRCGDEDDGIGGTGCRIE